MPFKTELVKTAKGRADLTRGDAGWQEGQLGCARRSPGSRKRPELRQKQRVAKQKRYDNNQGVKKTQLVSTPSRRGAECGEVKMAVRISASRVRDGL